MVLHHVHNAVSFLNTNTVFAGIMLLLLNVGSRFIVDELSHDDKQYSQNLIIRRLSIFAVCFIGTKDMITSIILTAAFVVLSAGLFRGKGPFSREGMVSGAEKVAVSTASNNPFHGSASTQDPALFGK